VPNPWLCAAWWPLAGPADLANFIVAVPRFESAVKQLLGGGSDADIARHMKEGSPKELLPLGRPADLQSMATTTRRCQSRSFGITRRWPRAARDSVQVISVAGGQLRVPGPRAFSRPGG